MEFYLFLIQSALEKNNATALMHAIAQFGSYVMQCYSTETGSEEYNRAIEKASQERQKSSLENERLLYLISSARNAVAAERANEASLNVQLFLQQLSVGLSSFLSIANKKLAIPVRDTAYRSEVNHMMTLINEVIGRSNSPIVLLDVDNTAALSRAELGFARERGNEYNQQLLDALKQAGIRDIYLFTSYNVKGVLNVADDFDPAPSRLLLAEKLNQEGFQVKGIITLNDPLYGQLPGQYYLDKIAPWEIKVAQEQWDFERFKKDEFFSDALQEEATLQYNTTASKGAMYEYLREFSSPETLSRGFIFIDDKTHYLEDVGRAHQKINQASGVDVSLVTIQCHLRKFWDKDTQAYYFSLIKNNGSDITALPTKKYWFPMFTRLNLNHISKEITQHVHTKK